MKYTVAEDARPQFNLLLAATIVSIGLWLVSIWLPLIGYVVYPLQLFATFVHEGGHALAALVTGSSVQSLTVSPDGSGMVWSRSTGWFAQLFISSAGYLGTTAFGVGLLAWMRYGRSSRLALFLCSGIVGVLTIFFGFLAPIWNLFENVTLGSVAFTIFSGMFLTGLLAAVAYFANLKWVNFALAFLAVQSLLNAVFSLRDLFLVSAFTNGHSDAANMAAATGIPAVAWVVIWILVSVGFISLGLRVYAVTRKNSGDDLLFIDKE
jgi:hypothetical protein